MIITGNVSRDILRENKFSINLNLSLSNCTGRSEIGLSGQGNVYKFSFSSGKIFDNDSRYFSSYLPNESVNIETNFSGTAYDYSINESKVLNSGFKQNFYAEKFYVNTTGATIDAFINIKSHKPTLSLSLPSSFYAESSITGYLITDSASGIKLFSGYFQPYSTFSFSGAPSGMISSNSPKMVVISESSLIIRPLISNVFFDTSAGSYSMQFFTERLEKPFLNYKFNIIDGSDFLSNFELPSSSANNLKKGGLTLSYGYQTNLSSLIPSSFPLDISLSYHSGITGYYGFVMGVEVASGGNGYLSAPTVTFSGGGGSLASGIALLGTTSVDYNSVLSVQMTSFGSGYTSSPTVLFSGGTGVINNILPTIASGTASTTFYTKSFTGSFDLFTGLNSNFVSYLSNSYLSGAKYVKTGSSVDQDSLINILINCKTFFDYNPLVAKLVISGINDNIIERYITGIR